MDEGPRLRDCGPCRLSRRLMLASVWVALVVVMVAGAGAGYLVWRLNAGPLELAGISARLSGALAARAGSGYEVGVGKVHLRKSGVRPSLIVDDFVLTGADGLAIVSAPRAAVALDLPALLTGAVQPTRLTVEGLDLRIAVEPDGGLSVATGASRVRLTGDRGAATGSGSAAGVLVALFDGIAAASAPLGPLREIGIVQGRLVFEDLTRGISTAFEGLEVKVRRSQRRLDVAISAQGVNGRWRLSAVADVADERLIELKFDNLGLDEIALIAGWRALPFDFDMPLRGQLRLRASATGEVAAMEGRIETGGGYFLVRHEDFVPAQVERLVAPFRWDGDAGAILVDRLDVVANGNEMAFTGAIAPPQNGRGEWRVTARSRGAVQLAPRSPEETALNVGRIEVDAGFDPARPAIHLHRFLAAGPQTNVLATGSYIHASGDRSLRLTLRADPMPVRTALRLWPKFVSVQTRHWLDTNIVAGKLESLRIDLDLDDAALAATEQRRPPPPGAVSIRFAVSALAMRYLPDVGPLTGVAGEGSVEGHDAAFEASRGAAELDDGGQLAFRRVGFSTVRDKRSAKARGRVSVEMDGTVAQVAAFLRQPGLAVHAPPNLNLAAMTGTVSGRVDVEFDLERTSDPHLAITARAGVTALRIANFLGEEALEDARLDLTIKDGRLAAEGAGTLFDAPARVTLGTLGRGPRVGGAVQGEVNLVMDEAARARMGWGGAGHVRGPVGVRIRGLAGALPMRADVSIDLTQATLAGPVAGLTKPAGRPASASFQIDASKRGLTLRSFAFQNQSALARGQIELGQDGGFRSARFDRLRLSPGDDLSAEATSTRDGLKLAVSGSSIDVRPLLQAGAGAMAGPADTRFQMVVDTKLATGFHDKVLSDFNLSLDVRRGEIAGLALRARAGRSEVRGQVTRRDEAGPLFVFTSGDAGTVLGFLNIYSRMEGGDLLINTRLNRSGAAGALQVRNFVLRNEPALAKLVAQGVSASGAPVSASAVPFERLRFGFQHGGGRLSVQDGILSGPEIGLLLDGSIDYGLDRVAMNGTFVPAYSLNNAFARIPLFGPILGGGRNEGLVGVTFTVGGRASQPVLNINPLSAIAPGFLRKIFGVMPAPGAQQPAPARRLPDMPLSLAPGGARTPF